MQLESVSGVPNADVFLAICRGPSGFHVGIGWRKKDNVSFLHYAWHQTLECCEGEQAIDSLCNGGYKYGPIALPVSIRSSLATSIVAACEYSFEHDRNLPYGLCTNYSTELVRRKGHLEAFDLGTGATCATYILKILLEAKVDLLDVTTWKSRADDEVWKANIVALLRRTCPEATEHIRRVESQTKWFRFRPTEVVAAAMQTAQRPMAFAPCVHLGVQIEKNFGE